MEALDTAIKERRWTYSRLGRDPTTLGPTCVVRRDGIRHCGTGESAEDALLDAYLSALKDVAGMRSARGCLN
ncbi:MAG: hypothetical protein ABR985_11225 [Methanotrichaceae archaeon]